MQIKLWPQVEKALKEMANRPEHKKLKVSVSKIANFALAQYIAGMKSK
jgi:hypothetical protein